MQRAWTRTADGEVRVTPWPWADTWPVARLSAKSGAVDLIVLAGSSGRTLAFGPGHLSASALPGEIGNVVIAGHRDTHFQFLQAVEIGEQLQMESIDGTSNTYTVESIDIVDSRKGRLLLDTAAATLSLVTCYPFDARESGGPLRYVVTARVLY